MGDVNWSSTSLTCVEYPQGDKVGQLLAHVSLIPIAVLVSYVALVLNNRDLPTICLFAGQMLNEAFNIVAKRILKHERPNSSHHMIGSANKYGMPSQHSQCMGFFTAYCCFYLIFKARHKTMFTRSMLIFLLALSFLAVLYSRVYLLYHYTSQCIVGAVIGAFFGYCWFRLTCDVFAQYFDNIIAWKFSRFLGLSTWNLNGSKKRK